MNNVYPTMQDRTITTRCPDCNGAVTNFRRLDPFIESKLDHSWNRVPYRRILYILYECMGCRRGGVAKIHDDGSVGSEALEWFFPNSLSRAILPDSVPDDIRAEYREAEDCAGIGAFRAAAGLLRSTLEKTLKANGYINGSLKNKIDEAAKDGVLTEVRQKRANEIRVFGNDVLHDAWRLVMADEVQSAHGYIQRILEDFYDHRPTVEAALTAKNRQFNAATTPAVQQTTN